MCMGLSCSRTLVSWCRIPFVLLACFQVVTLEGPVAAEVAAAADYLVEALPTEYVLRVVDDDDLKDV